MPATSESQRRAAGQELQRRREGKVKKQRKDKGTRPFGTASLKTLREFASK